MPFVYEAAPPESLPSDFPSLTSEVLMETFAQTYEENPVMSMLRAKELMEQHRTGTKLSAIEARKRLADYGLESDLQVSEAGITEAALNTLMQRKTIEKRRQEVFASSEGGFLQGAARLGVGLVTSLADPINVATAFIPIVGEARYANMLSRAGGIAGRTAVRAGVGAAEGLVGAAMVEPLIAASRSYEQADYEMADSVMNIAFGGLFGAGLHSVGGAISDGVRTIRGGEPTWRGLEGLSAEDSQLVLNLRKEIEDGMDARDIARVTEGWTAQMRKAVEEDIPKRAVSPAEAAHESLPPQLRTDVLKQAIVQGVTGEDINVRPMIDAAAAVEAQTPEFKRWFGDSRVVDPVGEPMKVYRGAESPDIEPVGMVFSATPKAAPAKAAYISMENPKRVAEISKEEIETAKAEGHDGVISASGEHFVPFKREQVRDAINTSGNTPAASDNVADAAAYADEVLAREVDTGIPTADALTMATEEAALAQSDLDLLAKRLGQEAEDVELTDVLEAVKKSERWAKAAELSTVCLIRGG